MVLVVDRSGSMTGEKIEQAKGAMRFVLNNLREGDTFNIVAYDSAIDHVSSRTGTLQHRQPRGGAGIHRGLVRRGEHQHLGALERAFGMLNDTKRPTYIVFLTDGLPTAGETNEAKIVDLATKANRVRARLFSFGVGYDVNSRLLDRLVAANFGQSEYVRPDEDIEAAVSSLYRRIGTPVLTDVELSMDVEGATASDGAIVSRTYPAGAFDLFAGDQAVIVGRYSKPGAAKVTLRGSLAGDEKSYDFPAELVAHSADDTNAFIAKLWAARRVGEIIDQLDLHGKNDELIAELVGLATKHGILTEYTSYLADETDCRGRATLPATSCGAARWRANRWRKSTAGTPLRSVPRKGNLKLAPQADAITLSGAGGRGTDALATLPAAERRQLQNAAVAGNALWFDARNNRAEVATNILQRGRKTFFRQQGRWVDSAVLNQEQQTVHKIEKYSDAYFALVDRHGLHVGQYLAIDGPVVVELDGETYEWYGGACQGERLTVRLGPRNEAGHVTCLEAGIDVHHRHIGGAAIEHGQQCRRGRQSSRRSRRW